ncbi:BAG domain-containing protein [Xylariaceae sp. FL1651]|nr:BAG domain-containing protein [Xylariaceae sp. FL1651]
MSQGTHDNASSNHCLRPVQFDRYFQVPTAQDLARDPSGLLLSGCPAYISGSPTPLPHDTDSELGRPFFFQVVRDLGWVFWISQDDPIIVKVASSQAILASSGAFQNITSLLPPALQTYVVTTLAHLSDAFEGPNGYLASKGASPTAVYSTLVGAAAIALPLLMSRYGWTSTRDGLSPFASQANSQDSLHVTDEDFSYITSEDLEHSLQAPDRAYDPHGRRAPYNTTVDDDILLIKNKSVTYPVHFPAFSIGDGRLTVRDVRDRAALVMGLSNHRASRIKMFYKGRSLKELDIPIRDYGVKNNSELLVEVPEGRLSDDDESSSTAEEVIVTDARDDQRPPKKRKNKNGKKKPKARGARDTASNLDVPTQGDGDSRRNSPDPSRHPSRVPSPAVPSGAIEKLEAIRSHFDAELLPLCKQFARHPPKDAKKLADEHRKISETVMQHVLLKLDEIDTGGDPDIRARRKDLVNYVQDVLKEIDERMPEGSKPNR